MTKTIIVTPQLGGKRLDAIMAKFNDQGLSRTSCAKLINSGLVEFNNVKISDPAKIVQSGVIKYTLPKQSQTYVDIPIIYEDENVLVIDKPEGVLSHAKGELTDEYTIADFAKSKGVEDTSNRPGIVHRLDRATSGVMIIAKNQTTKTYLQKQFSNRKVKKQYVALVNGIIKDKQLIMDWPITRNKQKPSQFRVEVSGKAALTHLKVEKRYQNITKLILTPTTGRTHQLRVHLKHLGHPIIGDPIYHGNNHQSSRMYLHAHKLEITLPGGLRKVFIAKLPTSFRLEEQKYD